ncbi:hypothetical protein ACFQQB_44040 [Nonomuraea rubra]|uniref:hypothetical protein n=1 Tax=Nonomuraea rubra TaxID=46180 RepID=UPI00360A0886
MEIHAPARRPAVARRTGYTIAAVIDGTLLYAINAHPGWQAVPSSPPIPCGCCRWSTSR